MLIKQTAWSQIMADCGDREFADHIANQIERKAGSYLPPITGVLHIALDEAKVA